MKLKRIQRIAHHRNGVAGEPFNVVLFTDTGEERSSKVAVLFEPDGFCAVLDTGKLAAGDIAFGSNSWRGDDYEPPLRQAIAMHHQMLPKEKDELDIPHNTEAAIKEAPATGAPLDVHQLLADRRQIAVIWSIEDVQSVRPDLTGDQAWQVLRRCERVHDCEIGFNWLLIETIADDLFPEPEATHE